MRWKGQSSAAARPTMTDSRSLSNCMRLAPIVRSSPPNWMPRLRMRKHSKRPIAKLRAGSMLPSRPSAPCWRPMTIEQPTSSSSPAMSQVTVTINGRQFRMACEDGQESHLEALAADFDQRIERMRKNFGEIGDTRLSVMAALTVADELAETGARLQQLEQELATLQDVRVGSAERATATQAAVAAALNSAAERIERITRRLNQTVSEGGVAMG